MDTDRIITTHYTHGALAAAIGAGLDRLDGAGGALLDKLGAVDEFHMGGRPAIRALAEALSLAPGQRVLDVGCGLGGTARYLASACGVVVEGIDLTPEFVEVGQALNRQLGLDGRITLRVGSALDLPFAGESFDAATLLHVGMNIADKPALFAGIARVLRPGARLAVYDAMRTGPGEVMFPVPWAGSAAASFLAGPQEYRAALAEAGFTIDSETDRREMALEMFRVLRARIALSGPPPLGLDIVMGPDAASKVANLIAGLEAGTFAPVQIVARRG